MKGKKKFKIQKNQTLKWMHDATLPRVTWKTRGGGRSAEFDRGRINENSYHPDEPPRPSKQWRGQSKRTDRLGLVTCTLQEAKD
jgi:hypothetical protein